MGVLRSRNGCLSCKKLRIKCDEGKPSCEYCTHRGRTCEYPEHTGKQQQVEKKSGIVRMHTYNELMNVTSHELLLLDFFRRNLSWPISRGNPQAHDIWRFDAVHYSLLYSKPVLHAILALSEYEYTSQLLLDREEGKRRSTKYLKMAITEHRREVSQPLKITKATPESLILTSILIGIYVQFGALEIPVISETPGELDFISVVRGANTLYFYFLPRNQIVNSFLYHLLLDPRLLRATSSVEFEFLKELAHEVNEELRKNIITAAEAKCYQDTLTDLNCLYIMAIRHNQVVAIPMSIIAMTDEFVNYVRLKSPLARVIFAHAAVVYLQWIRKAEVGNTPYRSDMWSQFFLDSYKLVPARFHHNLDRAADVIQGKAPAFVPVNVPLQPPADSHVEELVDLTKLASINDRRTS